MILHPPHFLRVCVPVLLLALAGCAADADDEQSTWSEKQQRTLNDPMNYRPTFKEADISGGDIGTFDRDAFKRDMDSLLLK